MATEPIADARPRVHRENRKKNRGRQVLDSQAKAVAKFIRVPPRKARLVMDSVRGRYALEALAFLRFIPNRAAGYISKVLASAVANAANNHGLTPENLKLVEARVDEGPRLKRMQPRAQGRAYRILKRMSHITVIVEQVEPKPRKPRKKTGTAAQAAREAKQAKPAVVAPTPVAEEISTAPVVATTAPEAPHGVPEETGVPQGPQTANTADKTDEIGAPVETDAEATA